MKEILKNDDELWEKIALSSGIWNVGDEYPDVNFSFHVEDVMDKNVFMSNDGIRKQLEISRNLNPQREKIYYFYYIRIPPKEHK